MTKLITHLRSNVIGYVALFFALSAGAYAAGLAPDSVKSKHIKDEQIQSADLGENSVMGTEVVNGSLTGADLAVSSVNGNAVAEHTLGEVPRATIAGHGGYGRQSGGPDGGSSCNPTDGLFITCAEVALNPTAPARFLLTARFTVFTDGSDEDDRGFGTCRLGSSAFGGIPGTATSVFAHSPGGSVYGTDAATITAVTDAYQPGSYSFGLDCRENDGGMNIAGARVTAVAISPF